MAEKEEEEVDQKPVLNSPQKSSMEILSELFGSFDAEPPVIVKKEKHKKKKKHKNKEKKHKKKSKKHKRSKSHSSDGSAVDLTDILVKEEKKTDDEIADIVSQHEPVDKTNGKKDKIIFKDLKCSSIFDAAILAIKEQGKKNREGGCGDISDGGERDDKEKKCKHRQKHHHHSHGKHEERKKRKRSRSPSRDRKKSRSKSPDHNGFYKSDRHKYCERERKKYKESDYRSRDDSYDRSKKLKNSFYKRSSSSERERWIKDRFRNDDRFRERSEDSTTHIDKKKLLEIARKNAIQMMKSGSLPGALSLGPQAQEKVIAAIKSGGKTIEELTDFCKALSRKEELGELSSISGEDSENDEQPFHHPFQLKERPIAITMNIKNSVPLPIKNQQERASELRIQFPVSSGQQHRKTESEWVPVSLKKDPTASTKASPTRETGVSEIDLPASTSPQSTTQSPKVFPSATTQNENMDVASIVSQRLSAMRKLQENPNDVQALNSMYKAQKEMNTWAESKQQFGKFTGTTGAQILSQSELSSGYQAWARKDQLQTAAPVSGGMGMHLLQKMGWKPGEGLGKEKTGALEPLLLEVKLDKKGIVAKEEQKRKQIQKGKVMTQGKPTQGKHPVSILGEYATRSKLGVPQYELCFECGPDHKKNFLFRVILNKMEYKPQVASPNKKEAKANAALVCLQALGILPVTPPAVHNPVPLATVKPQQNNVKQ